MTIGFEYWQGGEQPPSNDLLKGSLDHWQGLEFPAVLDGSKLVGGSPPGKPPPKPKPIPPGKLLYRTGVGSLAAWWPANASAGSKTWYDLIGNNDAPMAGTVPWALLGPEAFAADFPNNSANYFNAGSGDAICHSDMSIVGWVTFDAPPTTVGDYEIIFARSDVGNESYVLGVWCDRADTAQLWWRVGSTDMFLGVGPSLAAGQVYHVAVSGENGKGPGKWDLYVNGRRVGTSQSTGSVPFFATDSYIGRREWAANEGEMDGKTYDLRVYDRPLTPQEIAWLYGEATRWALYHPVANPLAGIAAGGPMALSGLSGLSAFFAGG